MSGGRIEGNRRYWERLMRSHARLGKDRHARLGKDRTKSVRPQGRARRVERGGRRDG